MIFAGTPLVSVIVTTHRRLALLGESVRSVIQQDYNNIEIVVVDDVGEAAVRDEVSRLARPDRAVRYIDRRQHLAKGGGQQARNLGRRAASGELLLFLDDDDLLAPTCLSARVKVLLNEPNVGAAVGQCALFDELPSKDGPLWCSWRSDQDDLLMFLSGKVPWQTSGPLWRGSALAGVGDWDESLISGHDYEFHIRALAKGVKFRRIPKVDYFWRRPRHDSYSGFNVMKTQYSNGAHIDAFARGLAAVSASRVWNAERLAAAWKEGIRLAVLCRLYGGSASTALAALTAARTAGACGLTAFLEARLCIQSWFRVGTRIPALSYLNRRGLIEQY